MEASGVMVSIAVPLLFVIVGQCCGIASRWFRLVVADVTEHTRCVVAGAVVVCGRDAEFKKIRDEP